MSSNISGNPFTVKGDWHKGSVHNHTVNSDGKHSVAELSGWYEDQGMNFIVITDHDVVADVSDPGTRSMLVIPGAEIGVCWDETFGAEILSLGIENVKRKGVHPQDVINDVLEQGGLPYISHPHLSGVYSGLMRGLEGFIGIEIYNQAAEKIWNRGFAGIHLDDLMANGKIVWALATDDRHRIESSGIRAWIEVRAEANTRDAILSAMRDGYYYSTTGPKIHDISLNDTQITVCCSDARQVTFSTLPWLSKVVKAKDDETLTEIKLPLDSMGSRKSLDTFLKSMVQRNFLTRPKDIEPHVRIEIEDGRGGVAWSNPIPLEPES